MSSSSGPPNNLPIQLTSLVGREREIAAITELLRHDYVRLLTLTGAPGIGKTRLGIQVAASMLADFPDGVFFVNLTPVEEPNNVIPTIVYTLGIRQVGDQTLLQCLTRFLAERQVLLVLDNFEQVVGAAPYVREALQAAVRLKVLVTSRELLRISGEHNFPVPPLSLPPVLTDQGTIRALAHLSSQRIAEYESVQLFAQRAKALMPDFALTESNALTVAGICSRLDGLPLPIELAAARSNHLAPQAILDRLQNRLRLLTGGTQDLPIRQRTLRATIEWSYNLLSEDEQRLFRRLAVFHGGGTLEAIEAVCDAGGDLGIEALDGVTSLIDKSLVKPEYRVPFRERASADNANLEPGSERAGNEPHFAMLETIHEYAREQLDATSDAQAVTRNHADYYLMLARQAEPQLRGPQQAVWLDCLESERENFRAALDWAYQHDIALGLELASVLGTFWTRRGHLSEGQERLSQMISGARSADIPPGEAMARALYSAGMIAWHQGDFPAARPLLEESIQLVTELQAALSAVDSSILAESLNYLGIVMGRMEGVPARRGFHEEALEVAREIGDTWSVARSLYQLGHVSRISGEYAPAQWLFEESLALFRASGDQYNIGLALIGAGLMAQQRGDLEKALSLFQESLAIYRAIGVPWAVASALYCLGSVALDEGDYASARSFMEESLILQRELGTMGDVAEGLENLGRAAYFQGDFAAASAYYREGLVLFQEVGDKYGIGLCLMDLAGVMIAVGKEEGAQVLEAARALLDSIGIQLNQTGRKLFDAYISAAREQIGERALDDALAAGQAMNIDTAIYWVQNTDIPEGPGISANAGAGVPKSAPPGGSSRAKSSPLTRREREIASLVAQGKSNRQIADALVMSERTVEWHTSNILSKLGLQSRAQIVVWAVEQGLTTTPS